MYTYLITAKIGIKWSAISRPRSSELSLSDNRLLNLVKIGIEDYQQSIILVFTIHQRIDIKHSSCNEIN